MDIRCSAGSVLDQEVDLLVFGVGQEAKKFDPAFTLIDRHLNGLLAAQLAQDGFLGKVQEWLAFPVFHMLKAKKVGFIGLGQVAALNSDILHKLGATLIRRARESRAKTLGFVLPGKGMVRLPLDGFTEPLVEGMWLGAYQFHAYRAPLSAEEKDKALSEVILCGWEKAERKPLEQALNEAKIMSQAVILARDLVNTPSADMTPQHLVEQAKSISQRPGISLEVMDRAIMEERGMGAALAVARGSMHEPYGVHLTYRPPKKKAKKRVALVGKAVTFDSGGLSIKTADGMISMKMDMAGAATILGLFHVLSWLKLPIEVHGVFLAVENMPSGTAYRPGDVVRAMNGKTIEVLNTDAEGRLTLADALCYVTKDIQPEITIDLATLTGACIMALGEEIAGLFCSHTDLSRALLRAAQQASEPLWPLPCYEPYREQLNSKIADVNNVGGKYGRAITAALFLSSFVEPGAAWAHIDLAGPAYAEKESRPDIPYGGTGYGVRLLARYLQGLADKK